MVGDLFEFAVTRVNNLDKFARLKNKKPALIIFTTATQLR